MKTKSLFREIIILCLSLVFVLSTFVCPAFADDDDIKSHDFGKDGNNLHWEFVPEQGDFGRLFITGDGEMQDFGYWSYDYMPWWGYHEKITGIYIGPGVTNIGKNAFRNLTALKSIVIPGNVKSIGENAIYNCDALETVVLLEGVETLKDYSFAYNDRLTEVFFPESLSTIGYAAFYNSDIRNYKINHIYYSGNDWNVTIEDYNESISDAVSSGRLSCKNDMIQSDWTYDVDKHFHSIKAPEWVAEHFLEWKCEESHYDNDNNGYCDVCGVTCASEFSYIDESGNSQIVSRRQITPIYNDMNLVPLQSGTYIVDGEVNCDFLVFVDDAKLILLDNCVLNGSILVKPNKTLTIYSQHIDLKDDNNMGRIRSYSNIGGEGTVIICGGDIEVHAANCNAGIGAKEGWGINSAVEIFNGKISAFGGDYSAGIGSSYGSNCTVKIHGGQIYAEGGEYAAGIGSGFENNGSCFADIFIDGGNIEAHGGSWAAGIGSGFRTSAKVNILGGKIDAYEGGWFSDLKIPDKIGSGVDGNCEIINNKTGSIVSTGNIAIIIGILAAAIVVVVLVRRKKRAQKY